MNLLSNIIPIKKEESGKPNGSTSTAVGKKDPKKEPKKNEEPQTKEEPAKKEEPQKEGPPENPGWTPGGPLEDPWRAPGSPRPHL